MKKMKATRSHSAKKSKTAPQTVDEYFKSVPEPARSALNEMRAAIRSAVPAEAVEVISYRIPAFKYGRVLVWFAAFSDHLSLFPTAAIIQEFKEDLKNYVTAKGTAQFPLDKPLPTALIKKMVKARVARAKVSR